MKGKVKSVTVTYPEDMDELRKQYSEKMAKVIVKIVPLHKWDELIKSLSNE